MSGKKRFRIRAAAFLLALTAAAGALNFSGCGLIDRTAEVFYDGLGTLIVGKEKEAEAVSQERYSYQCLDDETKKVYDQIVAIVKAQEETAIVSTREIPVLEQAFAAVMADYGEFFWICGYRYNSYSIGGQVIGLQVLPIYTMDQSEREKAQSEVELVAEQWLQDLPKEATDYEKSKYVFEKLIQEVEYSEDSENNQNILSVFLNKKTVCQGYAVAAVYLLRQLGIQAAVVTGRVNGGPHAWNLVRLDGEYYFMDVTWGNRSDTDGDAAKKLINYAYLNMTTEDLQKTHTIESKIPVPECTATEDQYYRREGRYFDRWEPEAIGEIFREAWETGDGMATVRLSDEQLYERTTDYFINNRKVSVYCRGMRTIHYLEDRKMCVLTLQF